MQDLTPNQITIIPAKEKILVDPINDELNTDVGGVGTTSADIASQTIFQTGDITLKAGRNIYFTSVTAPTACIATLIATDTGNVDNGTHKYKVSYVNATGETELGTVSNEVTVDATHKQVALSGIPVSSSGSITSRKIYRTKAGGTTYFLLTTINNNTGTTYTDNTADADLIGKDASQKSNTTFGKIIIDGIINLSLEKYNTFVGGYNGYSNTTGYYNVGLGYRALYSNTTGYGNVALGIQALYSNTTADYNIAVGYDTLYNNTTGYLNAAVGNCALYTNTTGYFNATVGTYAFYSNTEGHSNSAVGYQVLYSNTTGYKNAAVGYAALWNNTTGYFNAAVGSYALYSNTTGYGNVGLGYRAGYYETGSNKLFIDNDARADEADGRVKALIYGVFAAATADQKLTINGLLNQSVSKTPVSATASGTAGDICWDADYIYVAVANNSWKRVAIAAW